MIEAGKPFPEFSLEDQDGRVRTKNDFLGKWIVYYFYPKDDTPGCTIEANGFKQVLPEFHALGADVVGISKDTGKSHKKFCDKYGLSFTLLADPMKSLYASAQIGTKKFMGNTMFKRSTYIVDPKGNVATSFEDVTPLGHEKECLEYVRAHR